MHRIRRANRIGLAAAAGLALVGAGSAIALSANASGSTRASTAPVQIDSTACTETRSGTRTRGSCTFTLTDGRRYRCPLRFGNHLQTPRSIERATACHAVAPIRIRASWKPGLAHLDAAQACLARHGITARGGPFFENPNPRKRPIGELVLVSPNPASAMPFMAFIGFYISAKAAKRAEPAALRNAERAGGELQRHGSVIIYWTAAPPAQLRAAINACAFA